ncbi:hypothetical protein WJX79_009064 [Trebouxia sp. C0005]
MLFDPVFPAIDACTCQEFVQACLICYHKHGHALDQCIHVLIREPALISVLCCFFGVGPSAHPLPSSRVGLRSCRNRAASEACICLQVQQCLAYHAQLAII